MDAATGAALDGRAHLMQSVRDILTTPKGSRVHRREYGSDLPRLVDRPINEHTVIDVYAAAAAALTRWEPRLRLTRVRITAASPGRLVLAVEGVYRPDGDPVTLEGIAL